MAKTTSSEAVSSFVQPAVERRYKQFLEDNHGDITHIERLCEVMFNAGARHAITAMTQMSDVIPLINRVEGRIVQLRELIESLEAQD
jgi:hypothetical protein